MPTIPKIVTLLKYPDANVKRDACRTLAVIADKSVVPDIQPLLQDPEPAVVKDANDAIFTLNAK
jgi:HEAT repeat protein